MQPSEASCSYLFLCGPYYSVAPYYLALSLNLSLSLSVSRTISFGSVFFSFWYKSLLNFTRISGFLTRSYTHTHTTSQRFLLIILVCCLWFNKNELPRQCAFCVDIYEKNRLSSLCPFVITCQSCQDSNARDSICTAHSTRLCVCLCVGMEKENKRNEKTINKRNYWKILYDFVRSLHSHLHCLALAEKSLSDRMRFRSFGASSCMRAQNYCYLFLTYVFRFCVRPLLRTISNFGFSSGHRLTSTISHSIFGAFYFDGPHHTRAHKNSQIEHTQTPYARTPNRNMCKLLIEKEETQETQGEKISCLHWRKRIFSHRMKRCEPFALPFSHGECNFGRSIHL